MKRAVVIALLVGFVALAGGVSAQTLTGTVGGKVTDEQGGVLPGVTVTLTGRMGVQTQVTDAQGEFRFLGLNPGDYSVKADLQGFRLKEPLNFAVSISKTVDLRLTMLVGGMTETVEVTGTSQMVDTTSTATDTSIGKELLFSMPMTHANPAVNLLNYSPGINSGSAFGGAADGGNSLMLDGVDVRDPEAGTAWAFYNYNIIEEVAVGALGQPAEYGGFTGAIINTITKSGGNRYSFLSEYRYTSDSLSSKNASAENIAKNSNLAAPVQVLKLNDLTVQMGGPIKKDKLFFHATFQRYAIDQYNPPVRSEVSPRVNLKFTYQITPNDNLIGSMQVDSYNQTGRTGLIPGYAISNHDQTIDQDSPEIIYNGQYRKVFGSSSFFEAKFTGYWGYYDLNPVSPAPTRFDGDSSAYSGGAGYTGQYDRTRNQLNVSLSKYAQAKGQHNFKFGAEIERSTIRDRFVYSGATAATPTGLFFYDLSGPYTAYGYSYDLKGKNKRDSFYAQDQWKSGRFTANLGLRADRIRGEATTSGEDLYSTMSYGPRLGAAFDLTGQGTSVLRAYYGQLYDSAVFSSWSRAVPGLTPTTYYDVAADGKTVTPYKTVQRNYAVADDIKHPRTDEFNVSWEQQFRRTYKFTVTGIVREWTNFVNSVLDNATWAPTPFVNPMTPTETLTVYKWANPTAVPSFTIRNIDTVSYKLSNGQTLTSPEAARSYRGLMLMFQRAYANRWQAQVSWVLSSTKGTINNSSTAGISSGQFETPNTIAINNDGPTGYDRKHEVKVFAGYQIPKIEVSLNAYFRYLSGAPYTPYSRRSASSLAWTGSVNVNLKPLGSYLNDNQSTVDLRAEKVFDVGIHRFGVYADMANLFNSGTVATRGDRYPSVSLTNPVTGDSHTLLFGDPRSLIPSRQITFGARWSF
jgi:hypothetical protein